MTSAKDISADSSGGGVCQAAIGMVTRAVCWGPLLQMSASRVLPSERTPAGGWEPTASVVPGHTLPGVPSTPQGSGSRQEGITAPSRPARDLPYLLWVPCLVGPRGPGVTLAP